MKGISQKLDTASAAEAAKKAMLATERQERPADEDVKLVSVRVKRTDYNHLKGLFGNAGLSMSAGLKMCAFYMADMIEQGAFAITPGGLVDRRG